MPLNGSRGDAPKVALRYWGLSVPEYYVRADVEPLVPEGEIMAIMMIESVEAIEDLDEILQVPGLGRDHGGRGGSVTATWLSTTI
ncbi:hypothetical protein BFP70_06030 [Thioclava sp. SK-1]|uniref:hypothetical protein n=1 Tax=Thioclava sp. SK-1 TaxID=1889770 RepID=UPI0008246D58|nr:hypothetical protein [Thioclava sp. SK-1]OCX66258.1 hypothetical protein BFP70_06030 [Thioclava sp. SK-1]